MKRGTAKRAEMTRQLSPGMNVVPREPHAIPNAKHAKSKPGTSPKSLRNNRCGCGTAPPPAHDLALPTAPGTAATFNLLPNSVGQPDVAAACHSVVASPSTTRPPLLYAFGCVQS